MMKCHCKNTVATLYRRHVVPYQLDVAIDGKTQDMKVALLKDIRDLQKRDEDGENVGTFTHFVWDGEPQQGDLISFLRNVKKRDVEYAETF